MLPFSALRRMTVSSRTASSRKLPIARTSLSPTCMPNPPPLPSPVVSSAHSRGRYAMRDKIGEDAELGPYISPEDRATFGDMLEKVQKWLYSEMEDERTKVVVSLPDHSPRPALTAAQFTFCNKLDQLKMHGSPLEARAHEASARPEAVASFKAALEEYRSFVSSVNRGDKKYSHITAEQTEKVSNICNEAETWLEDKMNAQKDLALHQDPVVKAHEVKSSMKSMQMQCRQVCVCVCVCVCGCVCVCVGGWVGG